MSSQYCDQRVSLVNDNHNNPAKIDCLHLTTSERAIKACAVKSTDSWLTLDLFSIAFSSITMKFSKFFRKIHEKKSKPCRTRSDRNYQGPRLQLCFWIVEKKWEWFSSRLEALEEPPSFDDCTTERNMNLENYFLEKSWWVTHHFVLYLVNWTKMEKSFQRELKDNFIGKLLQQGMFLLL